MTGILFHILRVLYCFVSMIFSNVIYVLTLFLAALGLHCFARVLAAMSEDYMLWVQDYISVASLGAKCGSSLIGFSSCSAQAP